jgi:hypothetical protein
MTEQAQATRVFGLAASFDEAEELLSAVKAVRESGYQKFETYVPFPVEGLTEAMGHPPSRVPLITLIGATIGGCSAYGMMWFANVIHYPINVGGKPLNSWPAFMPITFELSVLGAAVGAVVGMLVLSRLPQPYHPMFDIAAFRRASRDRFFICIESTDPKFDRVECRRLLETQQPVAITEVPLR